MKNITVSVDSETYQRARVRAAEQGRSLSSLVREFLNGLGSQESEAARLKREEAALRAQIGAFRAGDRLPREALYDRREGLGG
jgi:plasmid stability protein